MRQTRESATNGRLGYPNDARLLLINADDFGMYPAINAAVVRAYTEGIVRSTSLMVPCPGASHAIHLLKAHPEIRFGVHLSIIRDIDSYPWDPLTPKERVPSLLDGDGSLYRLARMADQLDRAKLDEVEIEFRAQIEAVLAAGPWPTHLDWHCLYNGGRPDIFDLTLGLANEYGLALRVDAQPFIDQVQRQGSPTADHDLLDSFGIDIEEKAARYAELLRALPVGLTAWAVHPSLGSAESRAIDPDGWRVRRTDFDFLMSPQAREIIQREGITLISYEPLQRVWQRGSSA
ncbi:MAG: polysaccharide deacetylase family protein [Chloroflexota bacterium]|nr:polysaccharide deacetylase family protein [Chloroflexota bacterium]